MLNTDLKLEGTGQPQAGSIAVPGEKGTEENSATVTWKNAQKVSRAPVPAGWVAAEPAYKATFWEMERHPCLILELVTHFLYLLPQLHNQTESPIFLPMTFNHLLERHVTRMKWREFIQKFHWLRWSKLCAAFAHLSLKPKDEVGRTKGRFFRQSDLTVQSPYFVECRKPITLSLSCFHRPVPLFIIFLQAIPCLFST